MKNKKIYAFETEIEKEFKKYCEENQETTNRDQFYEELNDFFAMYVMLQESPLVFRISRTCNCSIVVALLRVELWVLVVHQVFTASTTSATPRFDIPGKMSSAIISAR